MVAMTTATLTHGSWYMPNRQPLFFMCAKMLCSCPPDPNTS